MQRHAEPILDSLGLGGDGDEIDVIENVERVFGVLLDYGAAEAWRTVGDVYSALKSELSPEDRAAEDLWPHFAHVISSETGVDPTRIGFATLLLGRSKLGWLAFTLPIAVGAALSIIVHWRS